MRTHTKYILLEPTGIERWVLLRLCRHISDVLRLRFTSFYGFNEITHYVRTNRYICHVNERMILNMLDFLEYHGIIISDSNYNVLKIDPQHINLIQDIYEVT